MHVCRVLDTQVADPSEMLSTKLNSVAGYVWGVRYYGMGRPGAGSIPFRYGVVSTASLWAFSRSQNPRVFLWSQPTLILLLPFMLQVALGGYEAASAVSPRRGETRTLRFAVGPRELEFVHPDLVARVEPGEFHRLRGGWLHRPRSEASRRALLPARPVRAGGTDPDIAIISGSRRLT